MTVQRQREFDTAAIEKLLQEDLQDDRVGQGVQLCVIQADQIVAEIALGSSWGLPMTATTLHKFWCALSKPLLAMCWIRVAQLFDVPIDATIDGILGGGSTDMDVVMLLNHSVAVDTPDMWQACLTPLPALRAIIEQEVLRTGSIAREPQYSEHGNYAIVERLVAAVTGMRGAAAVQRFVLDPLELSSIHVGANRVIQASNARETNCGSLSWPTRDGYLYGTNDGAAIVSWDDESATGPLSNATAVAKLYARLGACSRGDFGTEWSEVVNVMATYRSARRDDSKSGRLCQYGTGVLVGLSDHGFGPAPSPAAFGAAGAFGNSFGLYDPDVDLSIGFYCNAASREQVLIDSQRSNLIERIYGAVGVR